MKPHFGDAKLHGNIKPGIPSWKPITGKTEAGCHIQDNTPIPYSFPLYVHVLSLWSGTYKGLQAHNTQCCMQIKGNFILMTHNL